MIKITKIKLFLWKVTQWLEKPTQQQIHSLLRRYYEVGNFLFTRKYKLEFDGIIPCSELFVESEYSKKNASAYQAYGSYYFKLLLNNAISLEKKPKYFIDVGCGKGKQCIYAHKYFKFESIIGIDFSKDLIDIANKNLSKLNYNTINFLVADALTWKLPNEYCFIFIYNPFNEVILNEFIKNNIDNFKNKGSVFCYANDLFRNVLIDNGFVVSYRDNQSNSIYKIKELQRSD